MRVLLLFFCILLINSRAGSQIIIKKIDSLINAIENSNALTMISRCDTIIGSHSDYTNVLCDEFYMYNDKIFKIISKVDKIRVFDFYDKLYGLAPQESGTISMNVFYFDKDSLIKVLSTDYSDKSAAIYNHYFAADEIRRLKWLLEKYKDQYCQIRDWFDEAERLMAEFRQEKMK